MALAHALLLAGVRGDMHTPGRIGWIDTIEFHVRYRHAKHREMENLTLICRAGRQSPRMFDLAKGGDVVEDGVLETHDHTKGTPRLTLRLWMRGITVTSFQPMANYTDDTGRMPERYVLEVAKTSIEAGALPPVTVMGPWQSTR